MNSIRSMTKQERKAMDREIRKRAVEICNEFELDYDTVQIYMLHFYKPKWGKKQITDFHKAMVQERNELKKRYSADYGEEDPRIHFFAMRQKLKEKGIDVEAIRDEVMRDA